MSVSIAHSTGSFEISNLSFYLDTNFQTVFYCTVTCNKTPHSWFLLLIHILIKVFQKQSIRKASKSRKLSNTSVSMSHKYLSASLLLPNLKKKIRIFTLLKLLSLVRLKRSQQQRNYEAHLFRCSKVNNRPFASILFARVSSIRNIDNYEPLKDPCDDCSAAPGRSLRVDSPPVTGPPAEVNWPDRSSCIAHLLANATCPRG